MRTATELTNEIAKITRGKKSTYKPGKHSSKKSSAIWLIDIYGYLVLFLFFLYMYLCW